MASKQPRYIEEISITTQQHSGEENTKEAVVGKKDPTEQVHVRDKTSEYAAEKAKRGMVGYLDDTKEETKQSRGDEDKRFGEESWRRGNEGVIRMEDSRTGAVAERLKAADQMTGQTFNDVGPLADEGATRVGLLDVTY